MSKPLFGFDDAPPADGHAEACRGCQHPGPHPIEIMTRGKHYARVTCYDCGMFLRWLPKPENAKTSRRESGHRNLIAKFSRGYCEMCLCPEADLQAGQALEAHHVHEYHEGGEPARDNLWILCTECHALVNWRRLYAAARQNMINHQTQFNEPNEESEP